MCLWKGLGEIFLSSQPPSIHVSQRKTIDFDQCSSFAIYSAFFFSIFNTRPSLPSVLKGMRGQWPNDSGKQQINAPPPRLNPKKKTEVFDFRFVCP